MKLYLSNRWLSDECPNANQLLTIVTRKEGSRAALDAKTCVIFYRTE